MNTTYIQLRNRKILRRSKSFSDILNEQLIHYDNITNSMSENNLIHEIINIDSSDESFESIKDSKIINLKSSDNISINLETKENLNLETINNITSKLDFDKIKKMVFDKDFAIKIIPVFRKKEDFHKFCKCVEIVWNPLEEITDKAVKTSSKKYCMDIIISKLEGHAYNVVRYIDFVEWKDLKIALERKFLKRRSNGAVSKELISATQTSDVLSFGNKIENLLGELNEICIHEQGVEFVEIIQALNEKMALNAFINGLKEPIRTIVDSQNYDDLSSAIAKAIEKEMAKCSIFTDSNKSNSLKCSFCKKNNHSYENCFKRKNKNSNSNQNSSSDNSKNEASSSSYQNKNDSSNKLFCNYCKQKNHSIEYCFKKKSVDSKKDNSNSSTSQATNVHQIKTSDNISLDSNSENSRRTPQIQGTPVRVQDLSA